GPGSRVHRRRRCRPGGVPRRRLRRPDLPAIVDRPDRSAGHRRAGRVERRVFVDSQASFTSNDGRLNVLDADGCGAAVCPPLWTGQAGRSIDIASPTVAGGVVLVSGGDFVVAFAADGCGTDVCEPLWKGRAELMSNTPAVADGVVYVDAQPL